jgi:hypothetical protein
LGKCVGQATREPWGQDQQQSDRTVQLWCWHKRWSLLVRRVFQEVERPRTSLAHVIIPSMESVCIDPRRAAEQGGGPGQRRIFLTTLLVPFPCLLESLS